MLYIVKLSTQIATIFHFRKCMLMKFILFAAIFIAAFLLSDKLIEPRLTRRYCEAVLSDPRNINASLPSKLLKASMSGGRVFRSLSLPIPGRDGEEISIGTAVVNRSGVYIVCQIHGSGVLENPPNDNWKHINRGKCSEFENPFRMQKDARDLIEFYAKNNGFGDVKAHSMVIYTDPSLKFTHQISRSVISATELNSKMITLERYGKLSSTRVREVCKMLTDINKGFITY